MLLFHLEIPGLENQGLNVQGLEDMDIPAQEEREGIFFLCSFVVFVVVVLLRPPKRLGDAHYHVKADVLTQPTEFLMETPSQKHPETMSYQPSGHPLAQPG